MDGLEFEHWVADLFRRAGFQVEITQASGDHGVDLWASIGNRLVAVQCKRWDGMVGEPVLRDLYGAMTAAKAHSGCLVTTGTFTAQAHQFSKDKSLCLVGFDALMEANKITRTLYSTCSIHGDSQPVESACDPYPSPQQRKFAVDGLEVLYTEAPDVTVGHLQCAMPENPLKVESVSSALQVANREGVTKRMWGESTPVMFNCLSNQ